MLHNRIATDLRNHFSTVGPSPQVLSQHGPLAATPNPTSHEPTGPRLVIPRPAVPPSIVVPPAPLTSPRHSRLLPDLLATTAHRCAAFFAEAAVLVLVLGILDRLLSRGHIELPWIFGTFVTTLALLAASILTDVSARRWLRAH